MLAASVALGDPLLKIISKDGYPPTATAIEDAFAMSVSLSNPTVKMIFKHRK